MRSPLILTTTLLCVLSAASCGGKEPSDATTAESDRAAAQKSDALLTARIANESGPSAAALITGRLGLDGDGCVVIAGPRSTFYAVWPSGWSAEVEDGFATVLTPEGTPFASTGDIVSGGGGSFPVSSFDGVIDTDTNARCFPTDATDVVFLQTPNESSASQSPSQTPSGYLDQPWEELVDPTTGVRFELPEVVVPQDRAGGAGRLYEFEEGDVSYAVAVLDSPRSIAIAGMRRGFEQLERAIASGGARDTRLSGLREVRPADFDTLEGTLQFVATDGSRNYWRLRWVAAGRTLVQIQVLTFIETDPRAARAAVDEGFDRLVNSLAIPD